MLGAIAQTPELQISKEESAQIADALARVQAEFDVAIISPKAAAISNLGMTMAGIYVPRFIGMRARVAGEKASARKTQQQPQLISTERKQ